MDNNPSQTSKAVQKAMENIDAKFIKVPARSPDLNPTVAQRYNTQTQVEIHKTQAEVHEHKYKYTKHK